MYVNKKYFIPADTYSRHGVESNLLQIDFTSMIYDIIAIAEKKRFKNRSFFFFFVVYKKTLALDFRNNNK